MSNVPLIVKSFFIALADLITTILALAFIFLVGAWLLTEHPGWFIALVLSCIFVVLWRIAYKERK